MITFKKFIAETATTTDKIQSLIKTMLKAENIKQIGRVGDSTVDSAKSEGHQFVDTLMGKYIVTVFNSNGYRFVRVDPPRDSKESQIFYAPEKEK